MKTNRTAKAQHISIILVVVLAAILVVVEWIGGAPQSFSHKAFQVLQSDSVTGIADVHVTVCDGGKVIYQTTSDADGYFDLVDFSSGNLIVRFDATGYVSAQLVGQRTTTMQHQIRLFKEGILKGKVTRRKNNQPVAGARLNLWGPRGNAQALSDRTGDFYFNQLTSGHYTLQLQIDGFAPPDPQQIEIQGGETVERNFSLQSGSLVTGKILDKETGQPLKNIYIYLSGDRYYQDYTDASGFFSFVNVQPGTYHLTVYHEGFKELQSNTIVAQEGDSTLNQVYSLEPLDPQFQIYTYQQVFLPGEKIQTRIRSYRIDRLDCKLYRITPAELRSGKSIWVKNPTRLLENKKPLSVWSKKIDIKDITRWQTRSITFPVSQKALYILQLSGKGKTKFVPFFSTDLALITKSAPDAVLVWSHSLTNSAPYSATVIDVEQNQFQNGALPSKTAGSTDSQGLLRFAPPQNGGYSIWGFHGADAAYVEVYSGNDPGNQIKAYIYTDRPVYRPGHTVHFKGIVRKDKGDVFEIVPGFSCPLLIHDSSGTVVTQQQITTNRHGSFTGEFQLADEPALGTYSLELQTTGSPRGEFKVLEYRKPEFSIQVLPEKARYINGETVHAKVVAKYYFGAPVANQEINYTVLDSPYYSWNSYYSDDDADVEDYDEDYGYYGYGKVITTGTVHLDSNGEASINFDATREEYDRYYNIEAKVSDESRREVTGRGQVLVTRGEYKIGVFTDSYVFNAGEKIQFRVKTTDYDDKPVSISAELSGLYERWDATTRQYTYTKDWMKTVQTDASGAARLFFPAQKSGYVRIDLSTKDTKGNQITNSTWVWIAGSDDVYGYFYNRRPLDLVVDAKKKQPGEKTKLLINSSQPNVYALVSYEGTRLHKTEVVRLKNTSRLMTFTADASYAPTLYVTVSFSSHKQFYTRTIAIQIASNSKLLNVEISSDKSQYKPRETAKYLVKITDQSNKPVETEFSFSLVDESIYAISPELVPDIQKFFYGPSPNRVTTYYSYPPRYLGGADKDGNKEIRKDFPDTAYWNGTAETDAQGIARIEIKLPDSLTTWRATVRAASDETKVGSALRKIVATKTLIARLETPRFFTVGDKLTVTGVLHNLSSSKYRVHASLDADAKLRLLQNASEEVELNPNEIRRIDWKMQVVTPGTTRLVLKADASGDFDGMQLDIPVYPFGIQRFSAFAGQTNQSVTKTFQLPIDENIESAHLQLFFSPTVAGMAFDSLEYLTGYPYGCVEQTMSRFLPDIVVEQSLKQLNISNPKLTADLPKQINAGLQRLYHFQHEDGDWGWWENDESHPYMTAYVIYGLSLASQAGYTVDPQRLSNGINALKSLYEKEQSDQARSYMLFALSQDKREPAFVQSKLGELEQHLDQLDSYSIAGLVLASQQSGNQSLAEKFLAGLKKKAVVSETYAFWLPKDKSYGWCDNKIEATAYALRALLRMEPKSPLVAGAVRWLASQRQGDRWISTKDTAATIITLMEYLKGSNELQGEYTADIFLNEKSVGQIRVKALDLWNQRKDFDVYAPFLKAGENNLRIAFSGTGLLYFSGELRYFEDGNKAMAENKGIRVTREYFRYKRVAGRDNYVEEQTEAIKGNLKVGEEMLVKLTVEAANNFEYVIVEDPLPSGFEVVTNPGDYYEWTYWYCGRQIRDEKVAFFSTWLYEGKREIYYVIRGEVPGTVQASPSQSWAMYLPEIRGNSTGNRLTVID